MAILFNKINNEEESEDQIVIFDDDTAFPINNRSNSYERMCFGKVQIETLTKIQICILFLLALGWIIFIGSKHELAEHEVEDHIVFSSIFISSHLLIVAGGGLVLVALKKRKAILMWPFLIANGIWTALLALTIAVAAVDSHEEEELEDDWLHLLIATGLLLVYGWSEFLVLRAYMVLTIQKATGRLSNV
ncbi:hypothetical protein Ddc_11113 [Ditylenchus destructor]|nr:hypothetical protein Ddc_11113 [Ditylenchus destructor]